MRTFAKALTRVSCAGACGAALFAVTSGAVAGPPAVEMSIQVSNGFDSTFNPAGTDEGGGLFNYQGDIFDADFTIAWDFGARPDRSPFGQLGSNFTIESFSDQTLEFVISITLPMTMSTAITQFSGSSAWTLSGIDGDLATLAGTPLWEAFIDGNSVTSIYPDPSGISFVGPGSGNLSDPPVAGFAAGLNDTIGITIAFSLSPMDTATTSGVFNVIPAPGAIALLGVAGVFGTRRRRRG